MAADLAPMAEEPHAAAPVISNRSGRHVRMPVRFKDFLPGSSTHLAHMPLSAHQQRAINRAEPLHSPMPSSSPDEPSSRSHSPRPSLVPFTTEPDKFGLYCVYANEPTYTPQDTLESACDAPGFFEHPTIDIALRQAILGVPGALDLSPNDIFAPFTNPTSGILMAWQYSGTNQKSAAELDRLARLQTHPLYNSQHLKTFSHAREAKRLDQFLNSKSNPFHSEYGWRQSSVKIQLPKEQATLTSESEAPQMTIDGVWHRDLTDVITNVFESDASLLFNMTPFRQRWKVDEEKDIDVFSEAYSSSQMLHAYEGINALPREPGDDMEHVIASLMIWSDATHMTNFGNASMWPFYLYFGNQSKYAQGKPTAAACHHLAYIPKVSNHFHALVTQADVF